MRGTATWRTVCTDRCCLPQIAALAPLEDERQAPAAEEPRQHTDQAEVNAPLIEGPRIDLAVTGAVRVRLMT